MAKRATKPKVHYLNMGPWPYFVGLTDSPGAFEEEWRRLKMDGEPEAAISPGARATTHLVVLSNGHKVAIIVMRPPRQSRLPREAYAAVLAHEAVHVVQEMRDRLSGGDPLGYEAEAYLVQHIVQEGLQLFWRSKMRRAIEPVP